MRRQQIKSNLSAIIATAKYARSGLAERASGWSMDQVHFVSLVYIRAIQNGTIMATTSFQGTITIQSMLTVQVTEVKIFKRVGAFKDAPGRERSNFKPSLVTSVLCESLGYERSTAAKGKTHSHSSFIGIQTRTMVS